MRSLRPLFLTLVLLAFAGLSLGQIRSIQSMASRGGGGGGEVLVEAVRLTYLLLDVGVNKMIDWQTAVLRRKSEVPAIISIEQMMHIASQPSQYYILNPRIRGNWGILLTDFRMNYMFEHVPGGLISMRTDDWQILGLNVIQQQSLNLRISTGIMYEKFGSYNKYNESVIGAQWRSLGGKFGFMAEYRRAKNYDTGEFPRREVNASFMRTISSSSRVDLSVTVGGVYQNYYSEIPIWGLQTGLLARVH